MLFVYCGNYLYEKYIRFNAVITAFKSGVTKQICLAVTKLALVEFLFNLAVQYVLGEILFISLILRLNLLNFIYWFICLHMCWCYVSNIS